MKLQILDKTKKKKIINEISSFGIKNIDNLLIKTGNKRIRTFSGNLLKQEIYDLWRIVSIEGIGLYFAKEIENKKTKEKEIRLSIDALHLLKDQIKNKIININKEQEKDWFLGKDIELTKQQKQKHPFPKSFVIIKSIESKDILGTGKTSQNLEIVYNYLPKERRRKIKS